MKKLLLMFFSCVVAISLITGNVLAATSLPTADSTGLIKLVEDVDLQTTFTVSEGEDITLDLAGHKIEMIHDETITANHEAINVNKGKLIIIDSVGGGSIIYNYTGDNTGNGGYAANTITNNQGTLIVDGVTVVNNTEVKTDASQTQTNQIAYAIDNRTNGTIGDATLEIKNGAKIEGKKKILVRGFANSSSKTNSIKINGATINGGVQVHDANTNANKAELVIDGDTTINSDYMCVYLYGVGDTSNISVDIKDGTLNGENASYGAIYLFNTTNGGAPFNASITGGTFNGEVYIFTKDSTGGYNYLKSISGGTFSTDVSYCTKTDKEVIETEDGNFVLICKEHGDTSIINKKDATCEEKGYTGDEICDECGAVVKTGEEIKMLDHKTSIINKKEATCTEEGYTGDAYCEICEEIITKGKAIEKVLHNGNH